MNTYPTSTDNIPTGIATETTAAFAGAGHTAHHDGLANGVNALETKVGTDNSTDHASFDYKINFGWLGETNPVAYSSANAFQITGVDVTAKYTAGTIIRINSATTPVFAIVTANATLSSGNTIVTINATCPNPVNSVDYAIQPYGNKRIDTDQINAVFLQNLVAQTRTGATQVLLVDTTNQVVVVGNSAWDGWSKFQVFGGGATFGDDFRFEKVSGDQNVARMGGTGYNLVFLVNNGSWEAFRMNGDGNIKIGNNANFTLITIGESMTTPRVAIGKSTASHTLDVNGDIGMNGPLYGATIGNNNNTMTNQYMAKARVVTTQNYTSFGSPVAVAIDTIDFDPNNNFNLTTHQYTAPKTGYYQINASIQTYISAGPTSCIMSLALQVNSLTITQAAQTLYNNQALGLSVSDLIQLNAGDVVSMGFYSAGTTNTIQLTNNPPTTGFSIYLIST